MATKDRYRSGEFALTSGQVDRLLSVITDIRDLAMFKVVLSGGLRRLDVVGVKKADISFKECSLTFYENKKRRIKTIYLPQDVVTTIEMALNAFPKERDKRMFPICDKTAYNKLQMYLDRAGIPRRPFHSLRATCIKLCQAKGWTPEQTAELVGDKVQTIQEHYLTPSVEEMRAVVAEKAVI